MNARARIWLALGFGLLSLGGVIGSFALMFQAGCVGDTKSGAVGDPLRALELERLAEFPFFLAMVFGSVAIALPSKSTRRIEAFGVLVCVAACLWVLGIQVEIWGIESSARL